MNELRPTSPHHARIASALPMRLVAAGVVVAACVAAPAQARAEDVGTAVRAVAYTGYTLLCGPALVGGTVAAVGRAKSDDADGSWQITSYLFGAYNAAAAVLNATFIAIDAGNGVDPDSVLYGVVGTLNLGLAITDLALAAIPKARAPEVGVVPTFRVDASGRPSGSLTFVGMF